MGLKFVAYMWDPCPTLFVDNFPFLTRVLYSMARTHQQRHVKNIFNGFPIGTGLIDGIQTARCMFTKSLLMVWFIGDILLHQTQKNEQILVLRM